MPLCNMLVKEFFFLYLVLYLPMYTYYCIYMYTSDHGRKKRMESYYMTDGYEPDGYICRGI